MDKYTTQPEAKRTLAAQQMHSDMHPGPGVITTPTHEEIAKRAYEIYVKGGRKDGQSKQNWQQAEIDLRKREHRP